MFHVKQIRTRSHALCGRRCSAGVFHVKLAVIRSRRGANAGTACGLLSRGRFDEATYTPRDGSAGAELRFRHRRSPVLLTFPSAALLALIGALLETTVLPEVPIAGATADLVLVVAVTATLILGIEDG